MKKLAMIMAVAGLILVGAVPAQAANTWIVDAGGGGNFTTIQAAIDDTGTLAGDTLSVVDGTYTITAGINVSKGVTITGNVVNPGNVLVQYAAPAGTNCFDVAANNVTVQGVKVTNGSMGFSLRIDSATGPIGCKISNNIVDTCSDKGIYVRKCAATGEANRVEVAGNVLSGCGQSCIQTFISPYTYIYGNTINATEDKGINIIRSGATGTGDRIQVIGNIISDTKWPGIQSIGSPYTYIHDNTVTKCNYYGGDGTGDWDYASIHVEDDGAVSGANVVIDGNTITDGINGIQTWSDNVSITENDIYDMGDTYADTKEVGGRTYKNSGILVGSNWGDGDLDPSGVIVLHNNIYDNHWGLFHSDEMVNEVDGRCNWWGNAGGPGVGGANDVGALVNVSTWLDAPYPGGDCVPEPGTMCLLSLGALGLIRRRRRK